RTNARNTGNPTDLGDGEYAETGRLTFLPYYAEDGRYLVHFGASGSHRSFTKDKGNDQVRFRAFPEIRVGQYIFADTGSFRADSVDLGGAEFAFQVGPFALQSEYYQAWVNNADIDDEKGLNPKFHGWYVQATYFLTGENLTYRRYIGQRTIGVFD